MDDETFIGIDIHTLTEAEAAALPSDGSYYNDPGLRLHIDNENCVLTSRKEVLALIDRLQESADILWPE